MTAFAVVIAFALVGPLQPWTVLAQQSFDCSINGFCLPNDTQNLLGLPNGTLVITGPHPWDRVVKGSAATAWQPLEVDARATLAALHGVANDDRLPYVALDELRAVMFARLLAIAQKQAGAAPAALQGPLTSAEQEALDAFSQAVIARRTLVAQDALNEYGRWQADPCEYTVPDGVGFTPYDPGPGCGLLLTQGTPPSPPTKDQFTAYGAYEALKTEEGAISQIEAAALGVSPTDPTFTYDPSADAAAAASKASQGFALVAGLAGATLASGIASILALTSSAVAETFAALAGSFAVLGTAPTALTTTAAAVSSVSGTVVGAGVAVSFPLIIIAAAVVGVLYAIQFFQDQSVLPTLQEALTNAQKPPSIWNLANDPVGRNELFTTFVDQTLPSFDAQRTATVVPAPPTHNSSADPQFLVNGSAASVLQSLRPPSLDPFGTFIPVALQQTFMTQGWFVTRVQDSTGAWMPWQWSLTLTYQGPTNIITPESPNHTVGIQPAGFLDVTSGATKESTFTIGDPSSGNPVTVAWSGNQPPQVAPTVSQQPTIATPVTFQSGAVDPDGSIAAIEWFVQDPTYAALAPDFNQCSLTPPGGIDPVSHLPLGCPWMPVGDSGSGISHTWARPGTFGVMVFAMDNRGAVTSQQFTVVIGNLAPTLVIQGTPVSSIVEGNSVTVSGTVNFPPVSPGEYGALTMLTVDWGDGQLTQHIYPCALIAQPGVEADAKCDVLGLLGASGFYVGANGPLTDGPWPFSFTHSYAFRDDQPFSDPAIVKVSAETTVGGVTPTTEFSVNVANVPPEIDLAGACRFPTSIFDPPCVGGDIRDVPVGMPLTIDARLLDVPQSTHLVKVLWGDGTSSVFLPGCADAGCPTSTSPAGISFNGTPAVPPQYLSPTHTYAAIGNYPITIVADDGNAQATATATADIFGVSPPVGSTDVRSGDSVTYSFATTSPAGTSLTVTPNCGGAGQLTGQTASTFTCLFGAVASPTTSQVALHATVALWAFDTSLNITVLPSETQVSAIAGPTQVTEHTTAVYTYSVSASSLGTLVVTPSCGAGGAIAATGEGSVTCLFSSVSAATTTNVSVLATGAGGSGSSSLAVTVSPDTTPPVMTLPATIHANSTTNAGAVVTYSASATDAVSGAAVVSCQPQSGATFPVGTTTVSCSASDWKGNTATGSFGVIVADVTPPTLTLPASLTVDATSRTGTTVAFAAGAVDVNPVNPPVVCIPASGSIFPIGATSVACTAIDAAGNKAVGSFTVTVNGAVAEIEELQTYISSLAIDRFVKTTLLVLVRDASIAAARHWPNACGDMVDVLAITESRDARLTTAQRNEIVLLASRIRSVLGCGDERHDRRERWRR